MASDFRRREKGKGLQSIYGRGNVVNPIFQFVGPTFAQYNVLIELFIYLFMNGHLFKNAKS